MEVLLNIDEELFCLINQGLSSDALDALLIPLRHKLFWVPVYIFLLCFIVLNYPSTKGSIILSVLLCIVLADQISSNLIKKNVQRERPCHHERLDVDLKVPCSNGYSFTSSHAANHFAISSFLFLLFGSWKYRWILFAWSSSIAFAQVYVGIHYPSDVIAGSMLGLILGVSVFYLFNRITNKSVLQNA